MDEIKNKIIVCINGQDWIRNYSDYNLTFDSTEESILSSVQKSIEENFSTSIRDGDGWLYKTRKAVDSQNIYIIPNSTAGNR